jgi:hypothetical protein
MELIVWPDLVAPARHPCPLHQLSRTFRARLSLRSLHRISC